MRKTTRRWAAAGVAALAAGALTASWMVQPALTPVAPPAPGGFDTASVARGARIVAVGDCMVCHTAAGDRPYAGGLPLRTPFGTIYTTNITPDSATGIGNWSLAAFTRALRSSTRSIVGVTSSG